MVQLSREVAQGDNRINPSGRSLGTVKSRTSLFYQGVVAAGDTNTIPASGTQFYVTASNGEVFIRPAGGIFNGYVQGTGLQLLEINYFDLLEVRNENSFPVAYQLFVGFDQYIDRRIYLDNTNTPSVSFPTYPTPNSAPLVDITDRSGSAFNDINGNPFLALYREAIIISNTDTGVTLLLQKANSVIAGGPAIGAIFPQTSFRLETSGDYRLHLGGANINAVVSEIYKSIRDE